MKLSSVSSDPPPWGVKGLSLSEGKLSQRRLLYVWGRLKIICVMVQPPQSCSFLVPTRWTH